MYPHRASAGSRRGPSRGGPHDGLRSVAPSMVRRTYIETGGNVGGQGGFGVAVAHPAAGCMGLLRAYGNGTVSDATVRAANVRGGKRALTRSWTVGMPEWGDVWATSDAPGEHQGVGGMDESHAAGCRLSASLWKRWRWLGYSFRSTGTSHRRASSARAMVGLCKRGDESGRATGLRRGVARWGSRTDVRANRPAQGTRMAREGIIYTAGRHGEALWS
ncbi:hypothetical protein B0H14DRAFT_2621607 [Mycena olivaceomarginata]|nr:hypothetical protein B0H14DRAFT_2621607 [Mycena olivaceomarginata]